MVSKQRQAGRGARVLALVVGLLASGASGAARAQTCHGPDLDRQPERPFRAALATLAATYDVNGHQGNYEGVLASFAYRADWYGAEVLLPAYRLDRAQGVEYGIGDLMVTLRGTFLRAAGGKLTAGVELPVMLPTGDEARDLGMGRVMLMPDAYLALHWSALLLRAQAGYGYMFGDMYMPPGHYRHHHGSHGPLIMSSPLVNPMNMSEFEHALLVGLSLPRDFSVHARWWGAVPIASEMGVLREAVALGATAALARFDVTLELQRTLTGDAFEWKPLLQLGAVF